MKRVLLSAALFVVGASASATCTYHLKSQQGNILASHINYSCQQASSECLDDLRKRQQLGQNMNASCQKGGETPNNGGHPGSGGYNPPYNPGHGGYYPPYNPGNGGTYNPNYPGNGGYTPPYYPGNGGYTPPYTPVYSCTADMIRANGNLIDSYTSTDLSNQSNACFSAMNSCKWELEKKHMNGNAPNARCEIRNGAYVPVPNPYNPPYNPMITESCRSELRQKNGYSYNNYYIVDTFFSTQTGFNSFTVKNEACEDVMRKCNARLWDYQNQFCIELR